MKPEKAFKFCPRCSGNLLSKLNFLECAKCGFHFFINPAACNGAIIVNSKDEILLIKRKFDPFKGSWDLPGGFIERGESINQSIAREVFEELSVKSEVEYIQGIYNDNYLYQGISIPILTIIAKAVITGGKIKTSDDAADFKYFSNDKIPMSKIAFRSIKQALKDYIG